VRQKEIVAAQEKIEDSNIELRQIEQQRISFRKEMDQTEAELRVKLGEVEELSR
jgi:hypothetical protein